MPTPLVLTSTEVAGEAAPAPVPAGITVVPLHIVSFTVPAPSLTDGRPR
jgi:hypothetical protein